VKRRLYARKTIRTIVTFLFLGSKNKNKHGHPSGDNLALLLKSSILKACMQAVKILAG